MKTEKDGQTEEKLGLMDCRKTAVNYLMYSGVLQCLRKYAAVCVRQPSELLRD